MTNHPTADEIYSQVLQICPGISKGTVYRDLNRLAESGEILRVAIANAPDRYDLTTRTHTHCRCRECGRVFDFVLGAEPEIGSEYNNGFLAETIDVTVNGICGDCQRRKNG